MKYRLRLALYLVGAAILIVLSAAGPGAGADPPSKSRAQTVPTRTPTRPFVPTEIPAPWPTDTPAAPAPPQPGETPSPGASEPAASPSPAPAAASLSLTKQASQVAIWPGATVVFTLTLTNAGASSARQVVLEDRLPAGLLPGEATGAGAAWDGQLLRARSPVLPPGGRLLVVYSVRADEGIAAGTTLVNQATAVAAGGLRSVARTVLAAPPLELPPTGADGCPSGLCTE